MRGAPSSPSASGGRRPRSTCPWLALRWLSIVCLLLLFAVTPSLPATDLFSGVKVRAAERFSGACASPHSRLPSGVRALYPCPPAGTRDVFAPDTLRIVVTFIGAHMNLWYRTSLRTLVRTHCTVSHVRVLVWANELTDAWADEYFSDLRAPDGSPMLVLVRYNVTEVSYMAPGAPDSLSYLLDPPLGDAAAAVFMEPQVRMAHVTDVLRMVILWRFGGVYLDADILVLQPIHELGVAFAANFGNYECTQAINPGWPSAPGIVFPPALGGETVTCMCVCFLSFPAPGHAVIADVLVRGLAAFQSRGHVYGGFGAWVFMDALRAAVSEPGFDVRPISTTEILCWPQVLNATVPQANNAVAAIMTDCKAVHMMGGAHAKKFGSEIIGDDTLFGQVFNRLELGTCAQK